jgi:hypothetical protein
MLAANADPRSNEAQGKVPSMAELLRTNDPALISVVEGLLGEAKIPYHVADRNMSILEGSINAIRARILVRDEDEDEARQLLTEAQLDR